MVAHSAYEDLIHLLAHTAQSQSKVFALFIQRIVDFHIESLSIPDPRTRVYQWATKHAVGDLRWTLHWVSSEFGLNLS